MAVSGYRMDDDDNELEQDEEGSEYEDAEESQMDADEDAQGEIDDDDDEDEDDEDDDGDDDDDDDDDGDDDDGMDVDGRDPYARAHSPTAYLASVEARRAALKPSADVLEANGYSIDPTAALPHSAHVHAMALSADGTILLSGGSDGHVRRYDVYGTMNGKSMLTLNIRHGFAEGITKGGVLHSWWANEEIPAVKSEYEPDDDHRVSAVHSLAIQADGLWSLSGTASGNINLTTVRHDPGTIQYSLRRHKGPVSAMALTNRDMDLVSGGWDKGVHQWDLNTGQVVRSYAGHVGQISSLSFRPINRGETLSRSNSPAASPTLSINLGGRASKSRSRSPQQSEKRPPSRSQSIAIADEKTSSEQPPATSPDRNPTNGDQTDIAIVDDGAADNDISMDTGPTTTNAEDLPSSVLLASPDAAALGLEVPSSSMKMEDGPSADDLEFEAELEKTLGTTGTSKPAEKPNASSSLSKKDSPSRRPSKVADDDGDGDGDGDDSLFGDGSDENDNDTHHEHDDDADADGDEDDADAEGEEDADGEDDDADADAEGEEDDDDDGEDDDQPLSRMSRPGTAAINLPGAPGDSSGVPLPKSNTGTGTGTSPSTPAAKTSSDGKLSKAPLGGLTGAAGFDSDVRQFSNDILLSTTLGGQAILWDRRVGPSSSSSPSAPGSSSSSGGVRALPLPANTPPWCASATWSPDGERIYIGRRNEGVEEWDMRMLSDGKDRLASFSPTWSGRRTNPALIRTLKFPSGSGPVTSLAFMPNGKHLVCGSYDNIRLWNLSTAASSYYTSHLSSSSSSNDSTFSRLSNIQAAPPSTSSTSSSTAIPFRIVPGHHGGTVSSLLVDPMGKFLFSASGDRGWMSSSNEVVLISEIHSV